MIPVKQWLSSKGFAEDPFDVNEADNEPFLQRHFVHAIWFDDMCGNPQRPRSTILFADRGHGKSACRREIARICGTHVQTPALIVEILNYEWLLAAGLEQVTLQRYMQHIVRIALQQLLEMLNALDQKRQSHRTNLLHNERLLVQLAALRRWAGSPDTTQLPGVSAEQQAELLAFYRDFAQATDILKTLVELIQAAGFSSIYVLIDRVDEHILTENDTEAAIRLIHPLISSLPVMEYPGIAFKFFLPKVMCDPLYEQKIGRIGDRIRDHVLRWSKAELLLMLTRRLEAYSPIGDVSDTAAVHSFDELCESSFPVDDKLVQAAQASPRQLIELARRIVLDHCQVAESLESTIPETILSRYLHPVPLLRLDKRGDVWLEGKRQNTIRLTKLPRCLLELLWTQRHRYVSEDEIHNHLYPDAGPDEQRGKDAIYKLVRRLRDQLEPDLSNSKNYIEYVHGRGYRLCHFEDDDVS